MVCIDIVVEERDYFTFICCNRFDCCHLNNHLSYVHKFTMNSCCCCHSRDTKCVLAPLPCRPSKFRLLVDAQCTPSGTWSGFMPKHIEHPGSRHSNPAFLKIVSRPNFSASFYCTRTWYDNSCNIWVNFISFNNMTSFNQI